MNSHWSEYWSQGFLTSFGGTFKNNYEGSLKDCWFEVFETLPNRFRYLDIATGNGALPLLVANYAKENGKVGDIIGVDLAKIDESLESKDYGKNISIKLFSGVNCEELSSLEGGFDLVTSQFGIEYSNLELSIPQALNLISPNGYLGLVVHNTGSVIIRRNEKVLSVLRSSTFMNALESFKKLIECTFDVSHSNDIPKLKQNKQAESHRLALNSYLTQLEKEFGGALLDTELPSYVNGFFRYELLSSVKRKVEFINILQNELSVLELRLTELIQSAKNQKTIDDLCKLLSQTCELISLKELVDSNGILAWQIVCRKTKN